MVNLAEKHDDNKNSQLADGEISRILSALNNAEFKKSETQNARIDYSFKPRSLMEIAEEAQQQDEEFEAGKEDVLPAVEASSDSEQHPIDQPITNAENDVATNIDGLSSLGEPGEDAQPESLLDTARLGDVDQSSAGSHEQIENTSQESPSTSPFETAQAAFDRGHAEGITEGKAAAENELRDVIQAEIQAKLADKIMAFESALLAIAKPQSVDVELLSKSLQEAVVRLASAHRTVLSVNEGFAVFDGVFSRLNL